MRGMPLKRLDTSMKKTVAQNTALALTLLTSVWKFQDTSDVSNAQVMALRAHVKVARRELDPYVFKRQQLTVSKDIPPLIEIVRSEMQKPTSELRKALSNPMPAWVESVDAIEVLLHWLIKFWLFVPIELPMDPSSCNHTSQDLKESIAAILPQRTNPLPGIHLILPRENFSERSLTRKGGFEILLTSDLSLHLTFRERRTLYVFRHAKILKHLTTTQSTENSLFPYGFLFETLKTINLLFPTTEAWCDRRVQRYGPGRWQGDVEAAMGHCERLDLSEYPFYNRRLLEIQMRFDRSRPRTPKQFWFDDRNPVERATLIVALVVFVLTVVFGLIQSVTGILQVIGRN